MQNQFSNLFNSALTQNGADTYVSTKDPVLDIFAIIGSAQEDNEDNIFRMVTDAFMFFEQRNDQEQIDRLVRTLLWTRDARGGAGRRSIYRKFLNWVSVYHPYIALKCIKMTPELGRWDDVFSLLANNKIEKDIFRFICELVKNGLTNPDANPGHEFFKWLPREKSANKGIALKLIKGAGLTPRNYRRLLAKNTHVVETNMCNKEYSGIKYEHVPSLAMLKHQKAFQRHDTDRFNAYMESVRKGEAKVNTGVLYPHEVLHKAVIASSNDESDVLKNLLTIWENLPDLLAGNTERMLPICDMSGSMTFQCGSTTGQIISAAVGLYIAQRNDGPFKNLMISFSENPTFLDVSDAIITKAFQRMRRLGGLNTDLGAVFDLLLKYAQDEHIKPEEMPTRLFIISDMEFDQFLNTDGWGWGSSALSGITSRNFNPALTAIKDKYTVAGYTAPKIIFWNVHGREGNVQGLKDTDDVALVSGFSIGILKQVLKEGKMNPMKVMLDTIMVERYNWNK